ncbi:uncharacterized protein A1O9_09106 [Exophiala aquamarina CBS 119918]|uniref:ceramidase n=1 Tax=Exophiala aquamarina CBS 119918 TaxID=1182545 RepID=A0A072P3F7_9EURO|nr:uncharacterized protein A1O9_09106 [Exophiala aquamarina CBS 119918]KEF54664.1 hypothetical protein A1O9_09106 [Exophiala aquamarina CBS 119918]
MDPDDQDELGFKAPIFKIDLSRRPEQRYTELAIAYRDKVQGLIALFNDLLATIGLPTKYHSPINMVARLLLRRLHSSVETAELQGISRVTHVPIYLLVAFNVVLDLLMGCTSGAVKSLEPGQPMSQARMLHFRTLDWTMDPLRSVIVQLDFVRSKSNTPDEVIARSVTYCGYVGVLTGVRQQLSLSLNFRAVHNANTKTEHFRFYFHHVLVLLGWRQSISSILRSYLISENSDHTRPKSLAVIAEEMTPRHTTAAYLTFCDSTSTIILEKDFSSAQIRSSRTFIAATNHDEETHQGQFSGATPATEEKATGRSRIAEGLEELLEESRDRLDCISSKWNGRVRRTNRRSQRGTRSQSIHTEANTTITESEVIEWVSAYPTTNEQTHFAAIMDAKSGDVVWNRAYRDPLDPDDFED